MVRIILIAIIPLLLGWGTFTLQHGGSGLAGEPPAGGTVTFSGESEIAVNSAGNIVVTVPTHSSGNLFLASCVADVDETTDFDTPWTDIGSVAASSSRLSVAYREAGGSEPGTYTFTGATDVTFCGIAVYEKTSGTWDVTEYDFTGLVSQTSITNTAIAVADNSSLYLVWGSGDTITISTEPTSMTTISSLGDYAGLGSSDPRKADYYQDYTTGDASVTKTVVASGAADISLFILSVEAN